MRPLLLILHPQFQLFNLFLQLGVLGMKLFNELGYIDLLIITLVHALEQTTDHFIEALSHLLLLVIAHHLATSWNNLFTLHFGACKFQHVCY